MILRDVLSPVLSGVLGKVLTSVSVLALFAGGVVGVWFDPNDRSTLFQDINGTTPVTAPGQTCALMLDKSKGLVLGPELVTNGDFSAGTTGWTAINGTLAVSGGQGAVTRDISVAYVSKPFTTVVGRIYRLSGDIISFTGVNALIRKSDNQTDTLNTITAGESAVGRQTLLFTATATTTYVVLQVNTGTAVFDNISVKELAGNHATQPTAAQRPTYGVIPYGGIRNLLTYTEQFDNAVWVKTAVTITANAETAPDGTLTADRVEATGVAPNVSQDIVVNSTSVTLSAYFKKGTDATAANALLIRNQTLGTNLVAARVNLDTGAITYLAGSSGAASESVGNGWWKLTLTASITSGNTVRSGILGGYTATVGHFSFIWGAQLETGSTATAYQKVVSKYEVTEAGKATVGALFTDGIDDGMVTPSIDFSGTDKVTVWAGVQKLSDASRGMLAELGTGGFNTFSLNIPNPTSAYTFVSYGSNISSASAPLTSYPAPNAAVIAGIGDISGDRTTLQVNGLQVAQSTADQGTGNYSNNPAYLFRRGGTTLPFNGIFTGLIVRGAQSSAAQLADGNAYINSMLGAY